MDELRKVYQKAISEDPLLGSISSSSVGRPSSSLGAVDTSSSVLSSTDQSRLLLARSPRQGLSFGTCSKLCAICFVTGVIVGYTLKRRVRSWASKLLRRLKDD